MKDRIEDGEIEIVYCPTDQMVGDYFTKPLQGKKFKDFRNFIMGLHLNPPKERIGDNVVPAGRRGPDWQRLGVLTRVRNPRKLGME